MKRDGAFCRRGDPCPGFPFIGRDATLGAFCVNSIMDTLRPFQRKFLWHATRPGIDTAALCLPRGNGKSWLASKLGVQGS